MIYQCLFLNQVRHHTEPPQIGLLIFGGGGGGGVHLTPGLAMAMTTRDTGEMVV